MDFTAGEILIGVAVIGLVVFLLWFPTIMGAFVTCYERLGQRLEDHREERERKDRQDH